MLLDNNRNPWLLRSEDIWTIVGEISCDFSESGKGAARCGPSGFQGM